MLIIVLDDESRYVFPLLTAWDIVLYLSELSKLQQRCLVTIYLNLHHVYLAIYVIYVRFDFCGLSYPKLLVDSTMFDIIYRVGNFDVSRQIILVNDYKYV